MRVFTAIELPGELKRSLAEVQKRMGGEITPVTEDNLHVTLHFLGEIRSEQQRSIEDAIKSVHAQKFMAQVKGISYFGGNEIRVIYAKVLEGGRIKDIYSQIAGNLPPSLRLESERDYIPHITMARARRRGGSQPLKEFISSHSEYPFGEFEVHSIVLKKSVIGNGAPVYSTLYEFEL